MSQLPRSSWWAMFNLQRRGGELCQNCPGKAGGLCSTYNGEAVSGELCQNCPGQAGGPYSNYTGKAASYVKIVTVKLGGYVQITPARRRAMSKLSRSSWEAMCKLHRQGGDLCQNCPREAHGPYSKYNYVQSVPARLVGVCMLLRRVLYSALAKPRLMSNLSREATHGSRRSRVTTKM